jgi:peptidoglycan/xylan/chitin deacetylase (PgdA/CDA1 family)
VNRACWLLAAALLAVVAGCTVPGFLLPTDELLRDVYVRGPGTSPAVALTFDDGPNGRCTEAVLDALAALGAPATFFVLGANVAGGRNDELLARMVHEGHVIGIHSYSHGVRALFWESNTARELRAAAAEVEAALRRAGVSDPAPITLFRPPFGFLTDASARAAAAAGMHIVEWTVSVGDWRSSQRAEDVSTAILAQVRAGDVIVLHDGFGTHQRSIERCVDRARASQAVRLLVPGLAARGLRVVPLSTLFGLAPPSSPPHDV